MSQLITTHKHFKILLLFVVIGALLFNTIFWREKLAINILLFYSFIITAIVMLYPKAFKNNKAKWMLLAVVCSLAMVIIYNSALSCMACIISLLLLMAYCKYQHQSPTYASGSVLQTYWYFLPQFTKDIKLLISQKKQSSLLFKKFRFAILPLSLVGLFFILYLLANKVFADVITILSEKFDKWLSPLTGWIEPQRIVFLLIGIFITGGLLYRCIHPFFEKEEANQKDNLLRVKKPLRRNYMGSWQSIAKLFIGSHAKGSMALKYEYKAGMLSLLLLNILLLIINSTDIIYLWTGRQYKPGFEWPAYVHEGAEILVFSIILAMLVVLFFFKGNLNFFSGKKRLQQVAYIWLIQNAFLTVSVCIRNYYYISHMGIAYKRIGLFVFAWLVFAGLLSVFIKIRYVKTRYYLIKFNSAVVFATLIISTFVQWDVVIARYNLEHKDIIPVDVAFLLTLSDHTLPVLEQYKVFFDSQQTTLQRQYYLDYDAGVPREKLDNRINNFLHPLNEYTWLSWNLADAKARYDLLQKNQTAKLNRY